MPWSVLKWYLTQNRSTLCIDPHVGVAGVAVHVPPGTSESPVAHQHGDLVGRLRRERPEVPLHIVVTKIGVRAALLGADEVLELHRITHKEHGSVVTHHVVVAL